MCRLCVWRRDILGLPLDPPQIFPLEFDFEREWYHRLSELKHAAVESAELMAFSYRNFLVGAALLCFCGRTGMYEVVTGGNIKLHGLLCKKCAEMTAEQVAQDMHFTRIVGYAIYGQTIQPDAESGHAPRTLHPCPECRVVMTKSPLVVAQTRIHTFRHRMEADIEPWPMIEEDMTYFLLMDLHRNGNGH